MKPTLLLFATALLFSIHIYSQTGVSINTTGTEPDGSAMLDVSSTEKGILIPRMSEPQRIAIASPAIGLLVYQNDGTEGFYYFDGTAWTILAGGSQWATNGSNIYYNAGNVGIGTASPTATLNVHSTGIGEGNVLFTGEYKISNQGDPPAEGPGTRFMWYPDKAALRAGYVTGVQWDNSNIGIISVALGHNTIASSIGSTALGSNTKATNFHATALGRFTEASGQYSTAMGLSTEATGNYGTSMGSYTKATGATSTAMGRYTTAQAYGSVVMGRYNVISGSGTSWDDADPLFVIGNGSTDLNRSNAFTVLKNANTTIGGSLTINGNGTDASISFPTDRGSSGQVLSSDGSGGIDWVTPSSGTGSQWTTNGSNIYYNAGNVGIGTNNPGSPLQFSNSIANRKITLFTNTTNDHQFYGFGINDYVLRYQIIATNSSHVFYAGESSTSSKELFRIKGNGQIAIPALSTQGVLINNASGEISSSVGSNGQVLTTNGSGGISWTTLPTAPVTSVAGKTGVVDLVKADVGLGNVENSALSTWAGTSNIITLGTITTGNWNGTAIAEAYIGGLSASKITSGIINNARINWAAPGNIGSTTAGTGNFTSLSANNGLSVSAGTVTIKPGGNGGTNGQVLTTNGSGNATWQAAPGSTPTQSIRFIICVDGPFPNASMDMNNHFIGEIFMFAGPAHIIPGNFMECKGQMLNVSDYTPLFSLIGTTYGGNGYTTFALPNFTNKSPIGM